MSRWQPRTLRMAARLKARHAPTRFGKLTGNSLGLRPLGVLVPRGTRAALSARQMPPGCQRFVGRAPVWRRYAGFGAVRVAHA